MSENTRRLTDEERRFAEDHHDCILWFLRKHRLSRDDWYDIVAFGYLRAVKEWFDNPLVRRWAFPTIADTWMRQAVGKHWDYLNRKMRKGATVSLDTPIGEAGNGKLQDLIPDPDKLQELVASRLSVEEMLRRSDELERKMLCFCFAGYSKVENARLVGVSGDTVRKRLTKLWRKTHEEVAVR